MSAETDTDEARLTAQALQRLEAAADWVMAEGIATMAPGGGGAEALKARLFDSWTVLQRASPITGEAGIIALFRIKARGISYDIQSLYRVAAGRGVYDFWMVQKSAADWAGGGQACAFVVTHAPGLVARRKIVAQSDQFIAEYETPEGEVLTFPQDDLAVLYDLRAWQYPGCFPDSDLKDTEVILDGDGAYTAQPYSP